MNRPLEYDGFSDPKLRLRGRRQSVREATAATRGRKGMGERGSSETTLSSIKWMRQAGRGREMKLSDDIRDIGDTLCVELSACDATSLSSPPLLEPHRRRFCSALLTYPLSGVEASLSFFLLAMAYQRDDCACSQETIVGLEEGANPCKGEEAAAIDVEKLGRQRPEVFASTWREVAFVVSSLGSLAMVVSNSQEQRMNMDND